MSYNYIPHTWVSNEIISAEKMNNLEKAAEQVGKLKTVSETGNYNDLSNKPTINGNELNGAMTTDTLGLADVAQSGSYESLSAKPQINSYELSGDMSASDLGFANVAMSGAYGDLSGTPTALSQFTNDMIYQSAAEVAASIANANHLKRQIVDVLPEPTAADLNTIYMVPISGVSQNTYAEYMVVNNVWEKLGTSDVDLQNYMKTEDIENRLAEKVSNTRTVNGQALSNDITLDAASVGAVPTTRMVNGHTLDNDVTLVYTDISDAPQPMSEEEIRAIFS